MKLAMLVALACYTGKMSLGLLGERLLWRHVTLSAHGRQQKYLGEGRHSVIVAAAVVVVGQKSLLNKCGCKGGGVSSTSSSY